MEFTSTGLPDTPTMRAAFIRARDYFLSTGGTMSPERAEAIFDATTLSTARYLYDCCNTQPNLSHDLAIAAMLAPLYSGDGMSVPTIADEFGQNIAHLLQDIRTLNGHFTKLAQASDHAKCYALAYATAALDLSLAPPVAGMAPKNIHRYADDIEATFSMACGIERDLDQAFQLALDRVRRGICPSPYPRTVAFFRPAFQ